MCLSCSVQYDENGVEMDPWLCAEISEAKFAAAEPKMYAEMVAGSETISDLLENALDYLFR